MLLRASPAGKFWICQQEWLTIDINIQFLTIEVFVISSLLSLFLQGLPDVYTRVSSFLGWINTTILSNGGMSSCNFSLTALPISSEIQFWAILGQFQLFWTHFTILGSCLWLRLVITSTGGVDCGDHEAQNCAACPQVFRCFYSHIYTLRIVIHRREMGPNGAMANVFGAMASVRQVLSFQGKNRRNTTIIKDKTEHNFSIMISKALMIACHYAIFLQSRWSRLWWSFRSKLCCLPWGCSLYFYRIRVRSFASLVRDLLTE